MVKNEKTFIKFDESSGNITLTNPEPGDYKIEMKLEDSDGFSATYGMIVEVAEEEDEDEIKDDNQNKTDDASNKTDDSSNKTDDASNKA